MEHKYIATVEQFTQAARVQELIYILVQNTHGLYRTRSSLSLLACFTDGMSLQSTFEGNLSCHSNWQLKSECLPFSISLVKNG